MRRRKNLQTSMGEGDMISKLPDHIIHSILSLLPTKDAARTIALSKGFRSVWNSFPIIDLDFLQFSQFHNNTAIDQFLDFVRDSLQRRALNLNICVEKFRLLVLLSSMEADSRVDGAINYAIEHKVKELDLLFLHNNSYNDLYYKLPSVLFSVDSLKVLKLKGFNLETLDLEKFPSSEELSLVSCGRLNRLRVSNAQLKILEVKSCGGLLQIDISKSNLRSFSFTGKRSGGGEYEICQINLADCHSLTNLAIRGAPVITSEWFNNQVSKLFSLEKLILCECNRLKKIYIPNPEVKEVEERWVEERVSQLPLLESLRLGCCDMLRTLQVSHERLRSFQLITCSILEEAEIYAPNLISFRYEGKVLRSPLSVDSSHFEAELVLDSGRHMASSEDWYNELRRFLVSFAHCKLLILNCIETRNLDPTFFIFPDDLRETLLPPLVDLKHLNIKIDSQVKDIVSLVDGLLWLSPRLETMSIIVSGFGGEKNSLKFQYAEPSVMEEKDLNCCPSQIINYWRHHLQKVSMKNFRHGDRLRLMHYFGTKAMRLEIIET